jgi:hypothetical protein
MKPVSPVIPVKAGIQMVNEFPRQWDNIMNLSASRNFLIAGFRPAPE